jgi:hypothetical protein
MSRLSDSFPHDFHYLRVSLCAYVGDDDDDDDDDVKIVWQDANFPMQKDSLGTYRSEFDASSVQKRCSKLALDNGESF